MDLAKFYQYPTDGEKLTINFTLFNTVKKGEWRKNYAFLFLFALRNKLLKLDSLSFVPPYLYDIIIPGFKRLPLAFVNNYSVKSRGIIRELKFDNKDITGFLGKTDLYIPVPEAWEVSIEFESLLPQSANLMLSSIFDLDISVSTKSKK